MSEPNRGERYADGGFANVDVYYPDPARIERINREWACLEWGGADVVDLPDQ